MIFLRVRLLTLSRTSQNQKGLLRNNNVFILWGMIARYHRSLFKILIALSAGIALFAALGLVMRKILCVVTVKGDSMLPNLQSGERVVLARRPFAKIKKGEIVVVVPPYLTAHSWQDSTALLFSNRAFIKRVTALSGQEQIVSMDEYVPERHSTFDGFDQKRPTLQRLVNGCYKWHVPPGHCFVMSDNRKSRSDSRYWGPLPLKSVLGVVIMKLPP
jgi:signal peptidase I